MKITETKKLTSEIIAEMKKLFDVYCWYDMEQLDKDFPPPKKITSRYFKDNVEADEDLKNKSANDLEKEGVEGITLRERLLMEIQYFKETGNHLDVKNITLCSGSRYSVGGVPRVDWRADGRKVSVFWCSPSFSNSSIRARAAFVKPFTSVPLVPSAMNTSDVQIKLRAFIESLEQLEKSIKIEK